MTTYAIIGDGATGTTAAFYIRRNDPEGRIVIYSDESTPAYYRAALTNYLMGELRAEQLFAVPPNFYSEFKVERVLARVTGVDTSAKKIRLSDGREQPYDRLLLAAGSRPRPPSFPGAELAGVMTMRTMQDARFIMDQVQSGYLKHAIIVGGGILGLELVAGLRSRDVGVTYVIRGDHFMPNLLDKIASDLVLTRCRHFGVDMRLNEEIEGAYGGPSGYLDAARLKNSQTIIQAQLLAVAIGIIPNTEFLDGSGIEVKRGVPVDERMRTNVSGVFAGGDLVEVMDPTTGKARGLGLWEPSRHHGRIAGLNMSGATDRWRMPVPYNATRLYDLDLAAIGESVEKPGDEVISEFPETGRSIVYKKLVIREGRLVGALLLGQRKERVRARGPKLRQLISSKADVSEVKHLLLDQFFDLNSWMESMASQPSVKGKGVPPKASASRIMGRPDLSKRDGDGGAPSTRHTSEPAAPSGPRRQLSSMMRSPLRAPTPSGAPPAAQAPARGGTALDVVQPPTGEGTLSLRLQDGRLVTIDRDPFRIGRKGDNHLQVPDERVSSVHAEIRKTEDGTVVADVGSTNGTSVNGVQISTPHVLQHSDVIQVGDTEITFLQQILPPRAETGPVGLPNESIERLNLTNQRLATVSWGDSTFEINTDMVKIGRGEGEADIVVDDAAVSWLHAEITRHGDELYVRDLGSRNGTFVNGELIAIPRPLADGDVIHAGNTDFVFATGAEASAPTQRAVEDEAAAGGEPALLCTSGPLLGVRFALRRPTTTIGRDENVDIGLGDLTVSRRHAEVRADGNQWSITDAGSTNGTFVDDERLNPAEARPLRFGTRVRLGRVEFEIAPLPAGAVGAEEVRAPGPSAEPRPSGKTTVMDASDLIREATTQQPGRAVVVKGPAEGREFSFDELPVLLGRIDGDDIVGLGDQFVSGRHLRIGRRDDGVYVADVGSSNGSWLNDIQLEPDAFQKIHVNDTLRLGPATVMEIRE